MYFVANWKANKNLKGAIQWINQFLKLSQLRHWRPYAKIIICPPTPFLIPIRQKIKDRKNIYLGAQDISSFESGSYTGEVTAKSLQKLVDFTIIGHSERRKYAGETNQILQKKVLLAIKYSIVPIFCIRGPKDPIPQKISIIAYEPVSAIGTGNNAKAEEIIRVKTKISSSKKYTFLYGGSVNKDNISLYLKTNQIDGFLIGSASLNPKNFLDIVNCKA